MPDRLSLQLAMVIEQTRAGLTAPETALVPYDDLRGLRQLGPPPSEPSVWVLPGGTPAPGRFARRCLKEPDRAPAAIWT